MVRALKYCRGSGARIGGMYVGWGLVIGWWGMVGEARGGVYRQRGTGTDTGTGTGTDSDTYLQSCHITCITSTPINSGSH